jgi:hypothetical protein
LSAGQVAPDGALEFECTGPTRLVPGLLECAAHRPLAFRARMLRAAAETHAGDV